MRSKRSSSPPSYFKPVFAVLVVVYVLYLIFLYGTITSKFEHHRWNLPSRVYSNGFDLYPGRRVTQSQIKEKLDYLEYRQVDHLPQNVGEYYLEKEHVEIYLHSFGYPYEHFKGYPISFDIHQNTVTHLTNVSNEPVDMVQIEPELIGSLFDNQMEDRTFVSKDQVPLSLIQSIIIIEDRKFYSHYGIDPLGILRAFFVNLKSGRIVQGGSTLTQQLIKNYFLNSRRSFVRKINEVFMSFLMEIRYSKEEILEAYLNEIYLGQRGAASVAGVEEGAKYYFSKNVSQLSLSESALLAGLIRSPGIYSPFNNLQRAIDRRNLILKKLYENNQISQDAYQLAVDEWLPKRPAVKRTSISPHFMEYVKNKLHEDFPIEKLSADGLQIFTTIDMNLQRAAVDSVKKNLDQIEQSHPKIKKNREQNIFLEAALISLDPRTGFIQSYVGGRDYHRTQFDHITQGRRQAGSAFKPFVFLTALNPINHDPPYTLASMMEDEPLKLKSGGEMWIPQNYDKKYHGLVRLREVLEKSYNVASVKLALGVGLEKIIDTAKRAGIQSPLEAYPSLALGVFEVTPMELAAAYTVFPNQGIRTLPVAIRYVVTPDGKILEKKSIEMKRVFDESSIYLMNQLMQGVIDRGTATAARSKGFNLVAAGKTGTTSDYRDAWFVGYTPDLLSLTWVGYDDNRSTSLSGASGALPIWTDFMKQATKAHLDQSFNPAQNIIKVTIDNKTGLLFRRGCSEAFDEYFIEGTEPSKFCY